jgi:holin-like protein
MLQGIGLLLGCQFAGEFVRLLTHVPIPGPIIGLLLLFALLCVRRFTDLKTPEALETTAVAQVATPLLRHLAILFVPSGVGVLQYLGLFAHHALAVLFVLVTSTLVTMAAAALAFVGAQSLASRLRADASTERRAWLGPQKPITSSLLSPRAQKEPR